MKFIFHIFGAPSEYERKLIRRTQTGLEAARARGRLGGRPKIEDHDPKKIALARKLYTSHTATVKEICDQFGIGRTTLYRYTRKESRAQKVEYADKGSHRDSSVNI